MGIQKTVEDVSDERGGAGTASSADTVLLSASGSRIFHLKNIVVDNTTAAACEYTLYNGTVVGGDIRFRFQLAANETFGLTDLKGVTFDDDMHHITTDSAVVNIGGLSTDR